jgi:hypothetical protein
MKVDTAARLLGVSEPITKNCRIMIMNALEDPAFALLLAAMELNRVAGSSDETSDEIVLSRYNTGNPDGGMTEVGQRSTEFKSEILDSLFSELDDKYGPK